MSETIPVVIEGERCEVPPGISVAAALALTADPTTRVAVGGQSRAPFCGMGICQECRVTVNGRRMLACQTLCQPEMTIERSRHAQSAL
ncbi:2Fe-2S iron-sulfur cluster-binding protein [Klebsiella sp. B345]|uniref:2Fe-2S iron-sulfur cluster-binding protein n=1 Tax=Klebsiella sp. B345 TaxID=2755398 RepID=UPI003DA81D45